MIPYIFGFSWGIFLLLALIGWGNLLQYLFFFRCRIDWGQKSAWGLAFALFVGGASEAACLISKTAVFIFLGLGALAWILDFLKTRHSVQSSLHTAFISMRSDPLLGIGVVAVVLLAAFQYTGWVSSAHFSRYDEFQAYFVFPHKMLQAGCLGPDPFCDRRIASCLGGKSFLDTFVLAILPEKYLHLLDPGVALFIVAGLLLGIMRGKGIPLKWAVPGILPFLIIPLPVVNITALLIAVALFLSLFSVLHPQESKSQPGFSHDFIAALLIAGLCSLKSTFIPVCGIFLFLTCLFSRSAICFLRISVLTFLLLLPWMISEYRAAGTLLFPYLGKGLYEWVGHDSYAGFSFSGMTKIFIKYISDFYVVLLLGMTTAAIGLRPRNSVGRWAPLTLVLSTGLGALLVFIANGGEQARLFLPFVLPAIMTLHVQVLAGATTTGKDAENRSMACAVAITLAAGMLIGNSWYDFRWQCVHQFAQNFRFGMKNLPLVSSGEKERYARMQRTIPPGQTVFTRLNHPYLLDFKRNTIFICDSPGALITPRGMPFFRGPETLADYLVSRSIRYVAYSYATQAEYQKEKWSFRLNDTLVWNRTLAKHTFDLQDNLKSLGTTRKKIYDDGDMFVLDLSSLFES